MLALASKKFIDTTGPVRLVGRWSLLTNIYGFGGILITLFILLVGTPYGYRVVSQPCEEPCQIFGQLTPTNFADLQRIGISGDTYAISYILLLWFFTIACLGVSGLILWKKPGELVPFCAALLILVLPTLEGQFVFYSDVFQDYPLLSLLSDNYFIPMGLGMVYLFITFPNGKFRGKLYWFLFLDLGLGPGLVDIYYRIFITDYDPYSKTPFLPAGPGLALFAIAATFIGEKNYNWRNFAGYLGLALVCLVAVLLSIYLSDFFVYLLVLIYRSRTVLSPREKTPTKWLIYGFTLFVFMFLAFNLIFPALPGLYEPGSYFFLVLNVISFFGCGINLIGLFMSVLYANAFDINLVIKRTVVYSTLSLFIIGIYLGSVVTLQELVRLFTGQDSGLAIVGATLVSLVLFQPLRKAIQNFVDRRFYRRKYDAVRTIATLNSNLRNETDLTALTSQVRAVVDETMQPEMITFWVKGRAKASPFTKFK